MVKIKIDHGISNTFPELKEIADDNTRKLKSIIRPYLIKLDDKISVEEMSQLNYELQAYIEKMNDEIHNQYNIQDAKDHEAEIMTNFKNKATNIRNEYIKKADEYEKEKKQKIHAIKKEMDNKIIALQKETDLLFKSLAEESEPKIKEFNNSRREIIKNVSTQAFVEIEDWLKKVYKEKKH